MNSQLNEVISQIQNWTLLFMISNGKWEILISRLTLKQYYTSSGKIFRRKILLTVWQENMFSCSQWLFRANLDFWRIEEKFHEIETFHYLLTNSE